MRYPGGKNGDGVFQRIINQIPPHDLYVEPFAGSAAVWRMMRPSARSVLVDLDACSLDLLRDSAGSRVVAMVPGDGIEWLRMHRPGREAVVYCDPPYLPSTRSKKRIYRHEMTEVEHVRFLKVVQGLPSRVLISGYRSELYDKELVSWRSIDYRVMTRGGIRVETLWCNFDEPRELHDYRFLGENFREREKIRRQQRRWASRLAGMDRLQRLALMSVLGEKSDATW